LERISKTRDGWVADVLCSARWENMAGREPRSRVLLVPSKAGVPFVCG